jgi:ribosomal protein L5
VVLVGHFVSAARRLMRHPLGAPDAIRLRKEMSRKKKVRHRRSKPASVRQKRWVLNIDSQEAAVNLYSILVAFHQSGGGGLVDRKGVAQIAKWLKAISEQVPEVRRLAGDVRGPFRERDLSPIGVSLELDARERALMLYICKTIHSQLTAAEGRRNWIENQGRADYEVAVKNFQTWVNTLEREEESVD